LKIINNNHQIGSITHTAIAVLPSRAVQNSRVHEAHVRVLGPHADIHQMTRRKVQFALLSTASGCSQSAACSEPARAAASS
jgi:hypothetical protein